MQTGAPCMDINAKQADYYKWVLFLLVFPYFWPHAKLSLGNFWKKIFFLTNFLLLNIQKTFIQAICQIRKKKIFYNFRQLLGVLFVIDTHPSFVVGDRFNNDLILKVGDLLNKQQLLPLV